MKIAYYYEDGVQQIVLTPETDVEKRVLAPIHDKDWDLDIKKGSFYACRGGYIRHLQAGHSEEDASTMLVLRERKAKP